MKPVPSPGRVGALLAALREERDLMEAFAALADRQAAAIADADEDAIAALFGEGADIAARFDICRAKTEELAALCRAQGETDGETDELESQIEGLARRALSANAANIAAARVEMRQLGERIGRNALSRKGVVSYAASGASGAETAMLFDRMT
ncbi:MAG: hypothetical protein LBC21_00735 [Oscillospiraceae bacterium]|jgi:hypothetical protein|nr:hypothetical protein [Oscillospiraceae bacterium]